MPKATPITVVVGPTASGKTELAVSLAESLGGEIISADSVQVYQHFDVGSGKPTSIELSRARHHLIGCRNPLDPLDASRWAELASDIVTDIQARGRHAIVCGGTYLWVRALVYGLSGAPPADPAIRARHQAQAEAEGRAAVHAELARVDPPSAEKLYPNDFVRVSRALEVYELTGKPLSAWNAEHGFREPRYATRLVGVERGREELDMRIEARVQAMLSSGWIDEVRNLIQNGYAQARAMQSVGYRQVFEAVTSTASPSTPDLLTAIVQATRVFVRRQRTWLRDEPVTWIPPGQTISA